MIRKVSDATLRRARRGDNGDVGLAVYAASVARRTQQRELFNDQTVLWMLRDGLCRGQVAKTKVPAEVDGVEDVLHVHPLTGLDVCNRDEAWHNLQLSIAVLFAAEGFVEAVAEHEQLLPPLLFVHGLAETVGHQTCGHGKDEYLQDADESVDIPARQRHGAIAGEMSRIADVARHGPHKSLPRIAVFVGLSGVLNIIEHDGQRQRDPEQDLDADPEVTASILESTTKKNE